MTLYEKAAGLLFPRLGSNMPPPVRAEDDLERFEALLERCPVGGLILFNGRAGHTAEALARLQQRTQRRLLVTSDLERGAGQQVHGATVFPHAMAYAAAGGEGEALLAASARVTAREALAAGIHVVFAPDADVNRDPRNPIIATRAFGTRPDAAARLVRVYVETMRGEGLLTTAKHFPGHGNTHEDSHATLPTVADDRDVLDRTDLVPFRAAIEAGVDLVMTAHVRYPALDPTGTPATFSRSILTGLLREDMGFRGAVVTDSLLMGAVQGIPGDAGEQAAAMVAAGADLLLDPRDPEGMAGGIVRAVEEGTLPEARLDEALGRIEVLRKKLTDRFGEAVFADPSSLQLGGVPEAAALARRVARKAVTVDQAAGRDVVPLDRQQAGGLLVVLLVPYRTHLDPPQAPLHQAVEAVFPGATYREAGPETDTGAWQRLRDEALAAREVVVAMVVKPAAWRLFGLPPEQRQFVEALTAARPVVLASLGVPTILDAFPRAAARLCTYSDVPVSQWALVEALAGIE